LYPQLSPEGLDVKPATILATLATALAASLAATAAPAEAAVGSASINGTTATLKLDGADDNVTVSVSDGLLVHGQTTGGLNSGSDWDSAKDGDQMVPANGTFIIVVNGGEGSDSITVLAKNTEIIAAELIGDGGDDLLTGADSGDSLGGGEGNDRLVGAKGGDDMSGAAGTVWNNGDGSDFIEGKAGNDATEVNGNPTKAALPGALGRQLHRLAHAAHRQARQARGAEGRTPARQRALRHRPRRLDDAQGEAGRGCQRLAGRQRQLKALAVASTGPSGKIAQSSRRLTLAFGAATKR
jgi:hypothetical protein